jgi:holliday junction DNA helicase RuvA
MIAGLRGSLWKITINKVYIDVNGVVYELNISFKSYDNLKDKKGSQIYLFVYHSITDRSQKLFGFQEEKERDLFELLKSLQGIGEMTALRVLSFMTPSELIDSVKREDRTKLEKIPKVKGKTSEKILFEVKQNLKKFESFLEDSIPPGTPKDDKENLAVMALVQLGYDERTALKEVKKQIEKSPSSDAADIIRDVLKYS